MVRGVSMGAVPILLLAILIWGLVAGAGAADVSPCTGVANDSERVVFFFFSETCQACMKAHPVVENLSDAYPDVRFEFCDLTDNASVQSIFFRMGAEHGEAYPSYPAVFSGDGLFLEGYAAISEDLPVYLETGIVPVTPSPGATDVAVPDPSSSSPPSGGPSILIIVGAALVDGVNPCAFAVLVFLLVALLNAGSRKGVVATGFAYAGGVFLIYILSGLGILAAVRVLDIGAAFSIFAALIAILAGIFMVAEGLTGRAVVPLAIPAAGSAILKRMTERHTIPAAFVIGVLTGFFELPCTGGVYLAVLGMLASAPGIRTVGALLLYNLVFVLPLIVITLLVAGGLSPERIGRWREEYRKSLRLGMGLCMVGLGLFILAWIYL